MNQMRSVGCWSCENNCRHSSTIVYDARYAAMTELPYGLFIGSSRCSLVAFAKNPRWRYSSTVHTHALLASLFHQTQKLRTVKLTFLLDGLAHVSLQ
jgi:hypothetical protein